VTTPDFNRYMDIQQAINLKIHRQFLELGIPFASATQRQLYPPPPPQDIREDLASDEMARVRSAY
jgi:hypothetical protein